MKNLMKERKEFTKKNNKNKTNYEPSLSTNRMIMNGDLKFLSKDYVEAASKDIAGSCCGVVFVTVLANGISALVHHCNNK
jgi:hypothetical protein